MAYAWWPLRPRGQTSVGRLGWADALTTFCKYYVTFCLIGFGGFLFHVREV
jgi:hypothetical protein